MIANCETRSTPETKFYSEVECSKIGKTCGEKMVYSSAGSYFRDGRKICILLCDCSERGEFLHEGRCIKDLYNELTANKKREYILAFADASLGGKACGKNMAFKVTQECTKEVHQGFVNIEFIVPCHFECDCKKGYEMKSSVGCMSKDEYAKHFEVIEASRSQPSSNVPNNDILRNVSIPKEKPTTVEPKQLLSSPQSNLLDKPFFILYYVQFNQLHKIMAVLH